MKPTALVLFSGVLALASPATAAEPASTGMPLVIYQQGQHVPLWSDARTFDAAGEATPPLAPEAREALRAILSRTADREGCIRLGSSDTPDYALGPHKPSFAGDGSKLARLMRAATFVILGKVAGVSYGLGDGIPGALLEIQPQEVLRATKALPSQRHFVILPVGTIALAGTKICKASDLYPELKPEQDVLLFVSDAWGESDQVFRVSQMQVIPIPEKGEIRFPWMLDTVTQKDSPKERTALLDTLRALARGPEFAPGTAVAGGASAPR